MDEQGEKAIVEREIRARLFPQPGDLLYLHLADLLLAMEKIATSDSLGVLDYGAGLAPYRSLFPHSQYRTADVSSKLCVGRDALVQTPARNEAFQEPDYVILPDGRIDEKSNTFDLILSTQVLEHVADPQTHLSESFRLLKPGGKLFLTTHGSYEDHGMPYDFRRWTAEGLKYDLKKIGFEIVSVEKVTTNSRAIMWYFQMYVETMGASRKSLVGLFQWLCRSIPRRWIHKAADRAYSNCRVVPANASGQNIYLSLAALAKRPDEATHSLRETAGVSGG